MNAVKFPQANATFGAEQKEYQPLPAAITCERKVVTCFYELSKEELSQLVNRQLDGEPCGIFVSLCTFGAPLQPIHAAIDFNPPSI